MNNTVYKKLLKDLDNLEDQKLNYNYLKEDLTNIIEDIDNLYKIYESKITDEDIKIIIANYYTIRLREVSYKKEMEHNNNEIEDLERQIEILAKYFKNAEEANELSLKDDYSFASISEAKKTVGYLSNKNNYATLFNVSGVILLLIGIIHSITLAVEYYEFSYLIYNLLIYVFYSLVLFGIAGLFKILHDIRKKLFIKA